MNDLLRIELEEMHRADQAVRAEAMAIARDHGLCSPQYEDVRTRGREMDRAHTARLVEILEEQGWPGVSAVGEAACQGAFLVLQHAALSVQKRFLPLVRDATKSGEIPRTCLPLLEDRVRMLEGQEQLYGTQITRNASGKAELWPIEDADRVDERRASVGLEPLAAYLRRFGLGPAPADDA